MATASNRDLEIELIDQISKFYSDPLGFVLFAYPWGERGALENFRGPDAWQRQYLIDLGAAVKERGFDGIQAVQPIRDATASGHGIGKSTLVAMIVDWLMSTRKDCQGTVTANTFTQLSTKTWSAVKRWTKLCITGHWFVVTGDLMYHRDFKESWFCSAQSCKEENSEAFAGQHAVSSTSFYIFDEASAVPDKIYEVAEGGLTDGEPMIFLFGNPTRSSGKFYRACFGSERNRWVTRSVDSRLAKFTNKTQIQEWVDDYGEDSDFVRVRVKGLPPRASEMQYIDLDRVVAAQKRTVCTLPDDPLIMGIDVARGGADDNVMRFRRGLDASSIKPIRIHGEESRDSMRLVAKIAQVVTDKQPKAIFLDATGIGGPIGDRLRQLGYKVVDVQFGGASPKSQYANMRSFMWGEMKDWLLKGSIDKDSQLEIDLTGPGYGHDKKDRLLLESKDSMKARELDSPDDGDALALTFAYPVSVPIPKLTQKHEYYSQWS
jgi:hypothetical protein